MRKICLLFVSVVVAAAGFALEPDSLAGRIDFQQWVYPQEKVHVMTDRASYVGGDTVRFRAFVADASTLRPVADGSRFVYVELTDPFGENAARVKLRAKNGLFAGFMALPESMAEGVYTLNAYTLFQENQGKDYFFRKPLEVRSRMSLKYDLAGRLDDDGAGLTVSLTERDGNRPVRADNIFAADSFGIVAENIHKRSSHRFRFSKQTLRRGVVEVTFDRYRKFFTLPAPDDSFMVTFHPEGGYLLPGERNVMAFKALDSRGLGREIEGAVLTGAGDTAAIFASTHRGMGIVEFTPAEGERYHAVVDGRCFPIPQARVEAAVLRVHPSGSDSIAVEVGGRFGQGMILLAHNRARSTVAIRLGQRKTVLPQVALGSGISQLLLVDEAGNTLSSRMVFNRGDGYVVNPSTAPDSLSGGDYAVAVYAAPTVHADSASTLVASLLLQGDLAGHIEAPAEYFDERNSDADRNLDLLMLTQGWRRYDIPAALRGEFTYARLPMEVGGEISGSVRSRWRGKPMAGAQVCVLAPSIGFARAVETDGEGRFSVNGIDWPEGTPFAFQVFGPAGNREHNYEVDGDAFPRVGALVPRTVGRHEAEVPFSTAGTVLLDEISVTARRSSDEAYGLMMESLGARTVSSDDMAAKHLTSYEAAIKNIPGIRVENGTIVSMVPTLMDGLVPVELWVDGLRWEPMDPTNTVDRLVEFEGQYPISSVESLTYLKPSAALVVSLSAAYGGGALMVKTKEGGAKNGGDWDRNLFLHVATPLGYQKADEVYRPYFLPDPADHDGERVLLSWYPRHTSPGTLPVPDGAVMVVEGHDAHGRPVSVRKIGGAGGDESR